MKNLVLTFTFIVVSAFFANAQKPEHLTEATFKQKVHDFDKNKSWKYMGKTPAIVDFYADWCGPCRSVAPFLEELSKEYGTKIKVYKVNTDDNPRVASYFKITGIPSFLFINGKGEYKMMVGAMQKSGFEQQIKDYLKVSK